MSGSPSADNPLIFDPAFAPLKEYLIGATGLAYYADKDADLADRIARRLARLGLRDGAAYLGLLLDPERGQSELDAVIQELTIGETFFFRHRELFTALGEQVLPAILERNQASRRLRIWSAGCSIGAEPYSLAILLKQKLAHRVAGWDITIVGTDINREFLAHAREGIFDEWAFRTNPEDFKRTWFFPEGKSWRITPELKDWVSFQYHNLVKHPYPSLVNNLSAFDLILCRNVSIYFSPDIVRKILDGFYHCLVEGGWLLVGHAEPNTELYRSFRTVNAPGAVLYQKTAVPEAQSLSGKPLPPCTQGERGWGEGVGFLRDSGPLTPNPSPPSTGERGASGTDSQSLRQPLNFPAGIPALTWPEPSPLLPSEESGGGEGFLPAGSTATADLALIRTLADRGEWEKAEAACARLLQADKLNPKVHLYLALVREQAGRHPEAEASLRRAVYLDRNFVLAHYYLGLLLQKTKETKKAARSFQNVLQLLYRLDEAQAFADADGITVADLKQLTQMHLEVLEKS